ncbi:adenylyltransferase/sulfurtransferase MoeZ [Ornithinimicrobium pratense]|uniref:Adenylyltransferase/sulfurtransferase MoeZ n=2 Tax=Ornithinimicrobium pratense TaxID=2593973 RepID=A0A5J6VAY3_9MICO|nr:adenylyltransferase/sulfurtransferase MoeZ [Ornithinimicrobium pratense]
MGIEAQRRLLNARVAVVGAGGLGSPIVAYLAAAGVGHLTIIDDDIVDTTNLQRQVMHRADSIGTPKADSASGFARALNPDVTVVTRQQRITPENAQDLLRGHDVVLDGADNFPTRYAVSDACAALGVPVVWAAVLRFDAQLSTFVPGVTDAVTLRDLYPVPPRPEDVPSCAEAGVLGALVGQVGSIMAAEAVKLICGFGEPLIGRVLLVDALTQRTREIPLRPAGAVLAAVAREPVREMIALREHSAREVCAMLTDEPPVLLDVREPAEHQLGTVPGALCVPVGEVLTWDDFDHHLPDGPVVVYCKAGPRARRAAAHLVRIGREDVSVMTGGMLAWIEHVDPSLPSY